MLIDFFFDFETRSHADLKKVGTVKYATDPTTEVTLITWCFGTQETIYAWRIGQPIPNDLLDVALNPENYNLAAHNILFDYMIWTVPFKKVIPNLVNPPIKNITDNMAMTQNYRVGSSLDGSAAMLSLPYSKDKEGRRLMLKQCKPDRTGKYHELTSEEWVLFERYGIVDTKLLREIYYRCPLLPLSERWGFEWTFIRNLRGIKIDTDLVGVMEQILAIDIPRLSKEFEHLVGHRFKVGQRAKCLEFFSQYYPMENMQKDTVRDTLALEVHPAEHARRALEIKSIIGSTSLAKVPTIRRRMHEGRIFELLNFLKAHTKRWAGMGVQIHNFPRANDIEGLDDLNLEDLAKSVALLYPKSKDGCQLVKDLLRRIWIPDTGKTFYCGDFSKVEPTVLFWMAGLGPVPKKVYEETAAVIYDVPVQSITKDSEERQMGKNTFLGGGYGMGHKKFRIQVKVQSGLEVSEELAQKAIAAYRKKYWKVVQFWRHLESAFRSAIMGETVAVAGGRVHFMPMTGNHRGIKIRIPSGSFLYYHEAAIGESGLSYKSVMGSVLMRDKVYGGLLCEHIVSSTSRDLMLSSMRKLETAGFEILSTIHDEVWGQADEGYGQLFEQTMCTVPAWCNDLSITVESKNGVRYLK